jgi:outer membrane protein assembly factor BamB
VNRGGQQLGRRSVVKTVMFAGVASALPACSSTPKPTPAPLPSLTANQAPPLRAGWKVPIGRAGVGFAPVVAAGYVWAASERGDLVRVDLESGEPVWRIALGKPLVAGIGTNDEVGVVATRDGQLVAFGADGKERWRVAVGSEIVSIPAVGGGLVVLRAADNRVSAWDADTGKRRWTFQRQLPSLVLRQTNSPAVTVAAVFVGLPGGSPGRLGRPEWGPALGGLCGIVQWSHRMFR